MGWARMIALVVALTVAAAVTWLFFRLRRARFPADLFLRGALLLAYEEVCAMAGVPQMPRSAAALGPFLQQHLGGTWSAKSVASGGQMGGYWKAVNDRGDAVFAKVCNMGCGTFLVVDTGCIAAGTTRTV